MLAVLAVGAFVSINLLFKVTIFRVESYDGSQPVDTGIYTSDELIEALGIEKNSNLFAFSTAEKTQQLALQFPYLEHVAVEIQLCLLYTSPSPRDGLLSRMPSSA